ncbi:MAG: SPOR domain-containing protein [Betaproteobacteria bacterium]|nr:MAG: SPOR domain-containing protein [Betaproteobacteria bacterium]
MRALFLLLIAANLGFYAWTRQLDPRERGLDPEPMARQIEPEQLKLLSPAELLARSSAGRRGACAEWGSFTAAEAARAEQALAPLALGTRLAQRRSEETAHWWVFLPPQGGRQGAQRKIDELKALGVEEYFVMQEEGRLRWAISLGVFRTEESARARLESLKANNVRGAQLGERDTQVMKVWLQVRDANEALLARLKALAPEFPATELRECAAAG